MIFIGGIGAAVLALFVLFALRAKSPDAGTVTGRFDFDGYKASELSQRGLLDRTQWH